MIRLEAVYILAGLFFCTVAVLEGLDRGNTQRLRKILFWGVYGITFLFGAVLPAFVTGCLVILMVLATGLRDLKRSEVASVAEPRRRESAKRFGNRLLIPALLIPLVTFVGTLTLDRIRIHGIALVAHSEVTLVSLGLSVIVALLAAAGLFHQRTHDALHEGRRLMTSVGTVAVLPQLLAALGALFAAAGVGGVVSGIVNEVIPVNFTFGVVAVYAIGMALFTIIMGNAFAAFPVMTAGIGLPLLVHLHGGDPAVVAAIGMLSGYCGTLMTPMAANFNIVPAALLELPDRNGVIKVQIPTGILLLIVNIFLMYLLAFRF
ncbi:MAG TPA: DUF979 domain-containing protein [Gammaproteobacteria bacterium]|nr:DUF979 domain-containing protein [Gammaproteobacteria bacterium]